MSEHWKGRRALWMNKIVLSLSNAWMKQYLRISHRGEGPTYTLPSVQFSLLKFFSKICIFSPMFIFWLYFESTGDYCKHYRHYNKFLLYCISEIFWYKYNFASRAVNKSLEKTRSMCILLKKMYELIYTIMKKKIISLSKQNSDCDVYSGFFKSLCVISYFWTLSRATMLPAKLSPPLSLFCSGNIFFSKEEVKLH